MHDENSFPPLRDLPPGRLGAVKRDLLAEITGDAQPRRRAGLSFTRGRIALVGLATALALGSALALVLTLQAPRPSASSQSGPRTPPLYEPFTVKTTSGAQGVTSINLTVESPDSGASLQIQVLRSDASLPLQAMQQNPANQQVVYQEQVPMTDIPSPASGAAGTVARATWSGVLSPNDWTGGCQNSLYRIVAKIADPTGTYSSFSAPAHTLGGQWFNCSSG
jgi:hypothetical protein